MITKRFNTAFVLSGLLGLVFGAAGIQAGTITQWNGGTGNWSDPSKWDNGVPLDNTFDAVLGSGLGENVTLDFDTSINALTLGSNLSASGFQLQIANGVSVGLAAFAGGSLIVSGDFTNFGVLQTNPFNSPSSSSSLTISGHLFNNAGASFLLNGQDVANVAFLDNNGTVTISPNASLVTGPMFGVFPGSALNVYGSLNADALGSLNDLRGTLLLANGQATAVTPFLGTLTVNGGVLDLRSTLLTVTGDLTINSMGVLYNGGNSGGGTLTLSGALTNNTGSQAHIGGGSPGTGITLNVGTSLSNDGSLYVSGGSVLNVLNVGALSNTGSVYVSDGSLLNVTGSFINSGSLQTAGSSGSPNTIAVSGSFANNGGFDLRSGDVANIFQMWNNGTVTVFANATLNDTLMNNLNIVTVIGTLNVNSLANSGMLQEGGGALIAINGSTDNAGTIQTSWGNPGNHLISTGGTFINETTGALIVNGTGDTATISDLANAGFISIAGDALLTVGTGAGSGNGFQELANGILEEEIFGDSLFGVITDHGSAALNGTLNILLLDGYIPAVGRSFLFLTFAPGTLSGTFSTINGAVFNGGSERFIITYDNAGGQVFLTAVENVQNTPEPGTAMLTGCLIVLVCRQYRRRAS